MPSWFCVPVSSAVRRVLGRRLELGQVEGLDEGLPAPQHAHVGPVELVGRAGEEVGAERGHVHEGVGRVVDGVDEDERSLRVGEVGGPADVALRAERVRGRADREEARPRAEDGGEVVHVELARLGAEPHGPHHEVPLPRELSPRVHVRVVVELGDDDLVPRRPAPAEGAAQVEGQRRHVGAEGDLRRLPAEEVGEGRARRGEGARPSRRSWGRPSGCWRCGAAGSPPSRPRRTAAPACRRARRSRRRAARRGGARGPGSGSGSTRRRRPGGGGGGRGHRVFTCPGSIPQATTADAAMPHCPSQ